MSNTSADRIVHDIGHRVAGPVRIGSHRPARHRLLHEHDRQRRCVGYRAGAVHPSGRPSGRQYDGRRPPDPPGDHGRHADGSRQELVPAEHRASVHGSGQHCLSSVPLTKRPNARHLISNFHFHWTVQDRSDRSGRLPGCRSRTTDSQRNVRRRRLRQRNRCQQQI